LPVSSNREAIFRDILHGVDLGKHHLQLELDNLRYTQIGIKNIYYLFYLCSLHSYLAQINVFISIIDYSANNLSLFLTI